jgi:hypothetical protein
MFIQPTENRLPGSAYRSTAQVEEENRHGPFVTHSLLLDDEVAVRRPSTAVRCSPEQRQLRTHLGVRDAGRTRRRRSPGGEETRRRSDHCSLNRPLQLVEESHGSDVFHER